MFADLRRQDRVVTPDGTGTVLYVRMAPPDYREIAAVSVLLDGKAGKPGYSGTIYGADKVRHAAETRVEVKPVYPATAAGGPRLVEPGTAIPKPRHVEFYRGKQGRGSIHD